MIKPDAFYRGLSGKIISRFEEHGLKIVEMKLTHPTVKLIEQHYSEHKEKDFFPKLIEGMMLGPVIIMALEGKRVVQTVRKLIGSTDPFDAAMGTIRGDYAVDTGRNICHSSDSVEAAEREIKVWFGDDHTFKNYRSPTEYLFNRD